MEKERFTTIWEYASPAAEVTEEDLFRVCSMYLGGATPSEEQSLKSAIAKLLMTGGDRKSDVVLSKILKGENELTEYLSNVSSSKETKPNKDSLRTILDDDLAEDDEDDSSVDEVRENRFLCFHPSPTKN